MWTCPDCQRQFKTQNQSHSCVTTTIDDLFEGRPDRLILAFDRLLSEVLKWEPNSVGTSKNAIIFTNAKAWLIVKPMTKELDLKFYYSEPIEAPEIKKVNEWSKKYAHHIRIRAEEEISMEVLQLLRKGFVFALG